MAVGTDERPLALTGVPEHLLARPLQQYRTGENGERIAVRTRRRLRKLERVELVPEGEPGPLELDAAEERWILGAGRRRWPSIRQRYGGEAFDRAVELARAGVVRLRCEVNDELGLGEPLGWVLSEPWAERRQGASQLRVEERERWAARAVAAAQTVRAESPELATALLAAPPGASRTQVLVYAAEDLSEGVVSAGPRGFSQAHFGDSKKHDDVAPILRSAGVSEELLVRLGVRRSARLGVAGPVVAVTPRAQLELAALDGPVLVRADQPGLRLHLRGSAPLVIVENLQAAETLVDQRPDVAVIYTAGLLSQGALRLVAGLAGEAERLLLVPDADLGGVRIAEQVLATAPAASLVDIGALPHPAGRRWPADGVSERGLQAALGGRAAALARACLERGYPVEQELATVEAVAASLPKRC